MKKFLCFVTLIGILVLSSGCGLFKEMFTTRLTENDGEIVLKLDEEYTKYFPYEVPSYTLTFDGKINTTEERTTTSEVVFTQNDDYVVSKILEDLFDEYNEKGRFYSVLIKEEKEAETWMNTYSSGKAEKDYVKVLDSKIYNELAYIALENGLILSFNYAKFYDWDGNLYYRWQFTESIRMFLHYPFMVTEDSEGNDMFLLLPIPAGVVIKFDSTTKTLETILKSDKFKTDESYYTYEYVNDWTKETTLDYYMKNFNGSYVNGVFQITYLGYKFNITFNEKDFVIKYAK